MPYSRIAKNMVLQQKILKKAEEILFAYKGISLIWCVF